MPASPSAGSGSRSSGTTRWPSGSLAWLTYFGAALAALHGGISESPASSTRCPPTAGSPRRCSRRPRHLVLFLCLTITGSRRWCRRSRGLTLVSPAVTCSLAGSWRSFRSRRCCSSSPRRSGLPEVLRAGLSGRPGRSRDSRSLEGHRGDRGPGHKARGRGRDRRRCLLMIAAQARAR